MFKNMKGMRIVLVCSIIALLNLIQGKGSQVLHDKYRHLLEDQPAVYPRPVVGDTVQSVSFAAVSSLKD
jgi:hypothetical protein